METPIKYTKENAVQRMLVCPYCMGGPKREEGPGCCGEHSGHFAMAYDFEDGEIKLEHELETDEVG